MDRTWTNPFDAEPEAVIRQTGRWMHLVYISHGLMQYGPDGYGWHVLGARRAKRKATRELRRYLTRESRYGETTLISAK